MPASDRDAVRAYYDEWADQEWDRLVADPRGRVSLEIHRRFLARFVGAHMHVLEIGAGPGRFTIELAALGTAIDVTDLSPVQLELNEARVGPTGAESHVRSRSLLDICDVSRYDDSTFDAVVAYGGPLSYAFDEAGAALSGLLRIVRPGGVVVASVMSLLGAWRHFLPGVLVDIDRAGDDAYAELMRTGDLRVLESAHICRLFRSSEIPALVADAGGELVAMSASNWASLADVATVEAFESNPTRWATFLDHEEWACAEPGALDGGTHVLFAAQRPND